MWFVFCIKIKDILRISPKSESCDMPEYHNIFIALKTVDKFSVLLKWQFLCRSTYKKGMTTWGPQLFSGGIGGRATLTIDDHITIIIKSRLFSP